MSDHTRIDSHAHVFPYLGGSSGFRTPAEHLRAMQRHGYTNVNPVRRARDGAVVAEGEGALWNGVDIGPRGLEEVNLRVGAFGRLEWTRSGEDFYVQLFAPSLGRGEATADYLIAEMDYADVSAAVIQQGLTYGRLSDYIAGCVTNYPTRLIGLGQIDEREADQKRQRELLDQYVSVGLRGLFYSTLGFWESSYSESPDSGRYSEFWSHVGEIGFPVFWEINCDEFGPQRHEKELEVVATVLDSHPSLQMVLVHGLPYGQYGERGADSLPPIVDHLVESKRVLFELTIPISEGLAFHYPYRETFPFIMDLVERVGSDRIAWGSDMPNVARFCTYRQSWQFLCDCEKLGDAQLAAITGGNIARVFDLSDSR